MEKLKLYLDTSVISHLFAEDALDKMEETNQLWEEFVKGNYDIFISQVVIDEIERCLEPKRTQMLEKLELTEFTFLDESDEVLSLATEYIKNGVLKEKCIDDCMHIAYAVVYSCDAIVSWNFSHLVNFKTIRQVKVVNAIRHYEEMSIISPTMLLEEKS